MRAYAVFINEKALTAAPRAGRQLEIVMRFIRSLADNPYTAGDFTEKDDTGRLIQVKLIGRYAVTYWTDHAVAEIKVTHIKSADK